MENNELGEVLERVVASLTEEQQEKALACETVDQLIALLGDLGVELPDELLDDVGGGLGRAGAFLNRPLKLPTLGSLFKGFTSSAPATAIRADLKGSSPMSVVHTDVSAETKEQGSTRYV